MDDSFLKTRVVPAFAGTTILRIRASRTFVMLNNRTILPCANVPVSIGASATRHRPTIANTSDLRKRSTTSMKPIDGISSSNAVIDAI
jgi:hypothetical protein